MEGGRRGEGGGVEGSKVELAKNKLILCLIYSTLLYSPSLSFNPNEPLRPGSNISKIKIAHTAGVHLG